MIYGNNGNGPGTRRNVDRDRIAPAKRPRSRTGRSPRPGHSAIDALGYAPNHAAKSLRTLPTRKIIGMVTDVSNPFFAEVLRGTEEAAQAAGYLVLLGDTRDDLDREAQILNGEVARQWVTSPHDLVARSSTGTVPRR